MPISLPSHPGFLFNEDIPCPEAIVAMCKEAGWEQTGIPFSIQSGQPPMAWIKYGPNVTVPEALTQDWVAKALESKPDGDLRVPRVYTAFERNGVDYSIGYIVMQYVDAPNCDTGDVLPVAAAVQQLIAIRGPDLVPGPVGGGVLVHNFFYCWRSELVYESVEVLQAHINGILKHKGDTRRVDLVDDARDGLFLCPCDVTPPNFKKCANGQIVALDFGATSFLPPSFIAFAMKVAWSIFSQAVAGHVKYPESKHLSAMMSASGHLPIFMTNRVAMPRRLRKRNPL